MAEQISSEKLCFHIAAAAMEASFVGLPPGHRILVAIAELQHLVVAQNRRGWPSSFSSAIDVTAALPVKAAAAAAPEALDYLSTSVPSASMFAWDDDPDAPPPPAAIGEPPILSSSDDGDDGDDDDVVEDDAAADADALPAGDESLLSRSMPINIPARFLAR